MIILFKQFINFVEFKLTPCLPMIGQSFDTSDCGISRYKVCNDSSKPMLASAGHCFEPFLLVTIKAGCIYFSFLMRHSFRKYLI